MTFLQSLQGILGLLLVVAVGYLLSARGWFPQEMRTFLPRLVTGVALPPFLMCTILNFFQRETLLQNVAAILLPLSAIVITFALAVWLGRRFGVERRHFGLFCVCVAKPNTIFIGIPVNQALFGPEALPFVLLYYFACTSLFWTLGLHCIRADGSIRPPEGRAAWLVEAVKQILSPPMLGFLTGLALLLADVRPPDFLMSAAGFLGDLTTPLALIFIGITVQSVDLRQLCRQGGQSLRDMALALGGRLVLAPLIMAVLVLIFPVPELMGKVFIMQASLPVIVQVAILSAYYRTDPQFGSLMVSLSTLCSALTIPIYMQLLQLW
ncbi:MAG: AEC family transporter [Desulfovibrionaceae bacterium]|nr:AEC family transporter [Desulfovibrionaceae bacterium]